MDDGFGMEPVDDGFGAPEPHSEGNRLVINEVGDDESDNVLRERIGGIEDHGDGAHINLNVSLENDVTGASEEVPIPDDHIPADDV